jgi:hypothetical protein
MLGGSFAFALLVNFYKKLRAPNLILLTAHANQLDICYIRGWAQRLGQLTH